jgi:uncharacterized protein YraI
MISRSLRLISLILVLVLITLVGTAGAATGSDIAISLNCEGFSTRGGSIAFEDTAAVVIRAYDGAGTQIYEQRIARPAGGSYSFGDAAFAWSEAPAYSPLVLAIVSDDASIAAQEIVHLVVGNCGKLPKLADAYAVAADLGLLPLLAEVDGSTAPSVPLNTAPPRPVNETDVVGALSGYAVVNTDNLFVRSGPGTEYTPVGIVDGGTYLIVLGRSDATLPDDSGELWWYIEVGGLRGWVNSALLALRGDLSGVGVVEPQGELIPASVYVGFTGTRLYSEPSTGSAVVCTLVGNLFYPVLARDSATPNFYYVEASCENGRTLEGWLPLESVIYVNDAGAPVPIFGE